MIRLILRHRHRQLEGTHGHTTSEVALSSLRVLPVHLDPLADLLDDVDFALVVVLVPDIRVLKVLMLRNGSRSLTCMRIHRASEGQCMQRRKELHLLGLRIKLLLFLASSQHQ